MDGTAGSPGSADRLLEGLDEEQAEAVRTVSPVVRVIAGAGTGKTRVLTRRVAYRVATGTADAERCLVVTFTRAAAEELRARLAYLGAGAAHAGTLHATALGLLKGWWADRGRPVPALADREDLIRRIAGKGDFGQGALRDSGPGSSDLSTLSTEMAWAASRLYSPAAYAEAAVATGRVPASVAAAVAELIERYEKEKSRRSVIDFDDTLTLCARAFEGDAAFAAAQRWRFRHLFVDELQDLTPAQFRLLTAWVGDDPDLFAVGDPLQSIYAWNGSDPQLIERLPTVFPSTVTVFLTRNYRCTAAIASVAASFARAVLGQGQQEDDSISLPDPSSHEPMPCVHRFDSARDEQAGISRILRTSHARGEPWSSMAVLVRTNAQAGALAGPLESSGIPVVPITFHRAKGLEWRTVVLAGIEEGSVPLVSARSGTEAVAEEGRLFYVALTRGSHELHLTWAAHRRDAAREPSPYLAPVEEACARLAARETPLLESERRAHLETARAALRRAGE